MRVLFSIFPGAAHLYPVVPLARALLGAATRCGSPATPR